MKDDFNKNNITNMPKQNYDLISEIIKFIDRSDKSKGDSQKNKPLN